MKQNLTRKPVIIRVFSVTSIIPASSVARGGGSYSRSSTDSKKKRGKNRAFSTLTRFVSSDTGV